MKKNKIVGSIVMVFHDSATREKPESRAIILKKYSRIGDYYQVKFLSDGFIADRFILYLS